MKDVQAPGIIVVVCDFTLYSDDLIQSLPEQIRSLRAALVVKKNNYCLHWKISKIFK